MCRRKSQRFFQYEMLTSIDYNFSTVNYIFFRMTLNIEQAQSDDVNRFISSNSDLSVVASTASDSVSSSHSSQSITSNINSSHKRQNNVVSTRYTLQEIYYTNPMRNEHEKSNVEKHYFLRFFASFVQFFLQF